MNPISEIKAAIQPSTILKFALGSIVVFALFDLAGQTDLIFRPVTWFKAKFWPGAKA